MNRSIKAVLAASVAAVTAAFGSVPASASVQKYPKVGEWEQYEGTTVLPAKSACADEVTAHSVGAVRVTDLSKRRQFVEFDDSSKVTFTNTRTKATWSNGEGGDGYVRSLKGNYVKFAVAAEGDN